MSEEIIVGGRRGLEMRPWMALVIALSLAALSASVLCYIAYSLCYQAAANQARMDADEIIAEKMKDRDVLLDDYRNALRNLAPSFVCKEIEGPRLSCVARCLHPVVSKTPPKGRVEREEQVY